MAEAFGIAASALAVTELAAKTAVRFTHYWKAVSSSRADVERIQDKLTGLITVTESVRQLMNEPRGAKLRTVRKLDTALRDGQSRLRELHDELEPSNMRAKLSCFGLSALRWPFKSQDVERIVQGLERCVQTIETALQVDQTTIILDVDQKATLNRLPIVQGAAFDSHAEEHNPTCLQNTRVELLHEINQWIRDPTAKSMFWLNGMAGTGKSTVSRTLAHLAHEDGILGASFFFKRGEGDRGDVSKFWTTIMAQFAAREPAIIPYITYAIDSNPGIFDKAIPVQFQELMMIPLVIGSSPYITSRTAGPDVKPHQGIFDKTIPELVQQLLRNPQALPKISSKIQTGQTFLIIIDALDECDKDEDVELLIRLLSRAKEIQDLHLKFFMTSRPELRIRLGFKAVQGGYEGLILHEIAGSVVERDIRAFLNHEFARIRDEYNNSVSEGHNLPADWPKQRDIQTLTQMAVPLFIFAATVCRFICDDYIGNPRELLQEVLSYQMMGEESQLDATYLPVLDRFAVNLRNKHRTEVWARFREVVGSIINLANPLSASSLAQLLGKSGDDIHATLRLLHSVLSVPSDGPVKMFHLSFGNFLMNPEKQHEPFWIDKNDAHARLAKQCLRTLQEFLRTNIFGAVAPDNRRTDIVSQDINSIIRPEVQYACCYWLYHLEQSQVSTSESHEVHDFLEKYFLHWIEALSYMNEGSRISGLLQTLNTLAVTSNGSHILSTLEDASRFIEVTVGSYWPCHYYTPLQLYCTALRFAPKQSIVRSLFKEEFPQWILRQPQVEDHRRAFQPTLESHSAWVSSVTISPNGLVVASASHDRTIRLWDTVTGVCHQTLQGHSGRVRSIAFSPSSMRIASASYDSTIRLWNVQTGTHEKTLKGHVDCVRSVVFSPDNTMIASASYDNTIRLWDAETNACQHALTGHSSWVGSIAFSFDSMLLASGSGDNTIRLWNEKTGAHQQTFEGHNCWVISLAFSPDNTVLASASADNTVRLWEVATSSCLRTISTIIRVTEMCFCEDSSSLLTDVGSFTIASQSGHASTSIAIQDTTSSQSTAPTQPGGQSLGYGLSLDNAWITRNGWNLIRLPRNIRPACSAVRGSLVVIGGQCGKVLIAQLTQDVIS